MNCTNRKLYLARFTNKTTKNVLYKIGYCFQYNALLRFERNKEQYKNYDIRIVASAWGPEEDVFRWEKIILRAKPKTFWIEENFSGVTELRIYTDEELKEVYGIFKHLQAVWKKKRENVSG